MKNTIRLCLVLVLSACAAAAKPTDSDQAGRPTSSITDAERRVAVCSVQQDAYENRAYCLGNEP